MQRRILLVEHDRRAALAWSRAIAEAGDLVVGRATCVEDALRKVTALAPELVLVDVAVASDAFAQVQVPMLLLAERTNHDRSSGIGPRVALDVGVPELAVMIELLCRDAHDARPSR